VTFFLRSFKFEKNTKNSARLNTTSIPIAKSANKVLKNSKSFKVAAAITFQTNPNVARPHPETAIK
jgi:hypothetical protein